MKKLFFLLVLTGLVQTVKADTISFWHVYYNGVQIQAFNEFNREFEVIIKLNELKADDSITVKYFRDTPCHSCPTNLTVETDKHHLIALTTGVGTFNPLTISLNFLMTLKDTGFTNSFDVFYSEEPVRSRTDRIFLFRLKIE